MSDLEKIFTKMFEDAVKIFEGSSRILKDPVCDLEKIFTKIFEDAVDHVYCRYCRPLCRPLYRST